jgi:hypothetical protein
MKLILDRIDGLVEQALEQFNWKFERMIKKSHPETTGNCIGHDIAAAGTIQDGYYINAAMSCPHCYNASNAAMLEWDAKQVILTCSDESSKIIRILIIYHHLKNTQVLCGIPVDYKKLPYIV